jgi:DNA gyrase subunit A
MAIRFKEADVRPMGRNTSGVKGIRLDPSDELVGMVVADPDATLLTACAHGYGKRTPFGPNLAEGAAVADVEAEDCSQPSDDEASGSQRYRTQRRSGKGLRDIKTTPRNGPVIGVVRVGSDDELLMVTARGKIQRMQAAEVSVIGRNTQGVRIMTLEQGDTLAAVVRVPREANGEEGLAAEPGLASAPDLPAPPKRSDPE